MGMAKLCQSCSMPLGSANRGTEDDGSLSELYCTLCYENGHFRQPDMTVTQMQEQVINILRQKHWPGFLARLSARRIPTLERWRGA